MQGYLTFPNIGQVIVLEREREVLKTQEKSCEQSLWVTTLSPDQASPKELLELIRGHWGIENSLHWIRDTTYDEDRSQVRTDNGPRVMAALRNFAISLLRLLGVKKITQTIRTLAYSHRECLRVIGL